MAEVLFILTTIFVAYVVFVVVECEKRKKEESGQKARPAAAKAEPAISAEAAAARTATSRPARPAAARPAPARAPAAKPQAPAAAGGTSSDMLKNPKTGEVVKVTNNYRFAKRWIKEALVSEGLLDKIYKNNEIDDAATAKINAAIEQLKKMEKYH